MCKISQNNLYMILLIFYVGILYDDFRYSCLEIKEDNILCRKA